MLRKKGGGATIQGGTPTGGRWDAEEAKPHINVLEITAALFGLKCFCNDVKNAHVRILVDNTTTVAYINEMGGTKWILCDKVAREIWGWCMKHGL